MKRETAFEKAKEALVIPLGMFFGNDERDWMVNRTADVLQRECDQREGLIEMAKNIFENAGPGLNKAEASVNRWFKEYEKLKNV